MSPAITSLVNLAEIDRENLKGSVTNVLLQAILVQLEQIGETLKCLSRQVEQLKFSS